MNRLFKMFVAVLALFLLNSFAAAQPQPGARGPASRPMLQETKIPINPKLPTLWLIGDSTMRNGSWDDGRNGQWGWGNPVRHYFDESKINIQNRAHGGTSSSSFYTGDWPWFLNEMKAGDFLLVQFGHNDSGTPKGNGDEAIERPLRGARGGRGTTQPVAEAAPATQPVQMQQVHSFGWNLRRYVTDAKAKGVNYAIISTPIPRNAFNAEGKISADGWVADCKAAAETSGAKFLDLNAIIIEKYEKMGKDKVLEMFANNDPRVHTSWAGAVLNAECFVEGIKQMNSPLVQYLKPEAPKDLKNPSGLAR